MAKLYTKTGDGGETSLRGGKRCSKASLRVEAIGAVDELNSAIAVAIATIYDLRFTIYEELKRIQGDLFHIGALLGGETNNKQKRIEYLEGRVSTLEKEIDKIQKGLPMQKGFVLPGGAKPSAFFDFARAVCRQAERRVVGVMGVNEMDKRVNPAPISNTNWCGVKYLNRLSDYLYCLARWVNYKLEKDEIKWKSNFYSST
jgi:cob(I)alamin adenosyltransferase